MQHRALSLIKVTRIRELGENAPTFYDFTMRRGRIFYLRRDPEDELARLVVHLDGSRQEKELFDPNTIREEVHLAIDWYAPSYDGRYVDCEVSHGGSEQSTLYVLDVDSGKIVDVPISRARFARVGWLDDQHSFVYYRLPERSSDALLNEYYNDGGTHLHRLGDDPSNDRVVFGRGINPCVEIASNDFPFLHLSSVSNWVIGMVVHDVLSLRKVDRQIFQNLEVWRLRRVLEVCSLLMLILKYNKGYVILQYYLRLDSLIHVLLPGNQ